jgi:hypothetical protein
VLTYRKLHNKRFPGELALWGASKAQSDDGKKRAVLWSVKFAKVDVRAMAFSADGKFVLAVERGLREKDKATLRKFDASTGKQTDSHEIALTSRPAFAGGGARLIGLQDTDVCV